MCLDCFFEDPNRAQIEEHRKQQQEKMEKEELERKRLKEESVEKFKDGDYVGTSEKWDEVCKYL